MKVAVISDIHGNYDALIAVLKEAKTKKVSHLLILGDLVGYYYHPDKILKALSKWSYDLIKGNHEYILEDLIQNGSKKEEIRLKYGSGHSDAIQKLSSFQKDYLQNLPETKSVQFDKTSFLMSHGSPWANDFYIYPDCSMEIADKCNSPEHDFVLIGHSHYQFSVKNKNSVLINPGSIGQSRQTGGRAYWCIVNTDNNCFQMLSTSYSTENLLKEVLERDPDIQYLSTVLNRK